MTLGIALTSGNDKEEETDLFSPRTVARVKPLSRISTLYTTDCDQELTRGDPRPVPDSMSV